MRGFDFTGPILGRTYNTSPAPVYTETPEPVDPVREAAVEYDPDWWYKQLTPEQQAYIDSERAYRDRMICRIILGYKW